MDAPHRWRWMIFAVGLVASLIIFGPGVDWSTQSWLDVAAYTVSGISALGVILYAILRSVWPAFWRTFRWVFGIAVIAQTSSNSLYVAGQRGFTGFSSVAFMIVVFVAMSWICFAQWFVMSKLSDTQRLGRQCGQLM